MEFGRGAMNALAVLLPPLVAHFLASPGLGDVVKLVTQDRASVVYRDNHGWQRVTCSTVSAGMSEFADFFQALGHDGWPVERLGHV